MEHNAAAQEVSHLISCHLIFFSIHCSEIPSGPSQRRPKKKRKKKERQAGRLIVMIIASIPILLSLPLSLFSNLFIANDEDEEKKRRRRGNNYSSSSISTSSTLPTIIPSFCFIITSSPSISSYSRSTSSATNSSKLSKLPCT